jgi:hypothetical protein
MTAAGSVRLSDNGMKSGGRWTDRRRVLSEGAAAEEENEDHGRARQGDQGQGAEVGDQMEVDAHGEDGGKFNQAAP